MKLISLDELKMRFDNRNVYIPLYQRNYKWTDSKTEKNGSGRLMNDIIVKFRENSNQDYNLGMITVYETVDRGIQILDGQQRLITLSLIMKCLGKADHRNWIELNFERDRGFGTEGGERPRHDYIFGDAGGQTAGSEDVRRMAANYDSVKSVKKMQDDRDGVISPEELYRYIMDHVKILYRETKREPIDEFLNINFNKTPFCAADYIKSYMVMESAEESGDTDSVTLKKIMDLWRRLEHVLYQLEETDRGLENDMFRLIKQHYKECEKNRLEVLFEDRYYRKSEKSHKLEINCDSYHSEMKLDEEYKKLSYFYTVMKNLLEELHVVDAEGKKHPNYTAYSAYNLLCRKNKGVRFFQLFREADENVHDVLYKQFNLTSKSYDELEKLKDIQASNQFMEALLVSQNTISEEVDSKDNESANSGGWLDQVAWKNCAVRDCDKFHEYHNLFKDRFEEFIDLVEAGKKSVINICSDVGDGRLVLEDLLKSDKIKQIKIPQIQRDYVMGSNERYLVSYLCRIRFEELKERINCIARQDSTAVFHEVYYMINSSNGAKVANITYGEIYDLLDKVVFSDNRDDLLRKENCTEEGFFENTLIPFKDKDSPWETRKGQFEKLNSMLGKISRRITSPDDFRTHTTGPYGEIIKLRNSVYDEFSNIIKSAQETRLKERIDNKMSLSCIMGYLDENGTFWVYDGQQRLTTSVILLLHSLCNSNEKNDKLRKWLNKFSFEGRDGANHILKSLLMNVGDSIDLETIRPFIDDQTSFAIYKVLKLLEEKTEWQCISRDYLLRGMDFELIQMEELDDAEQLFMEMNEGLKLTDEEMYKAQLCHIISGEDLKKSYVLCMDNDWLDSWQDEVKEVAWLKYCITMAYSELNGYDAGRERNSLHGVTDEVIKMSRDAMNIFKSMAQQKTLPSFWVAGLITWCDTIEFVEGASILKNGKIYFSKADFIAFIERYMAFTKSEGMSCCFHAIKEFRENGYVSVPNAPELGEEDESTIQRIFRWMMENRLDRYSFINNTSKWEILMQQAAYDNDKFKTDYYYQQASVYSYEIKGLRIPENPDWMNKCNENYLFAEQKRTTIKNNLGYYYYGPAHKNDKLWLVLSERQEADVKNSELSEEGRRIQRAYHFADYIEWIQNVQNLDALPEYVLAIVELGIEKGLCYVDEMNVVKLTVSATGEERDFLSLLQKVQNMGSLEEGWDKDYSKVIESVISHNYRVALSDALVLRLYKNCDERFKFQVHKFIALYYLNHLSEKLAYSAREYFKKDKEILNNLPFRYNFEECKSVLPWEWVSREGCDENCKISFIKDSGLGYEENGDWIYKP